MRLVERAPCKVNFYLRINGKRADGYHQLQTIMQTVDLCDELIFEPAVSGIRLECSSEDLPTGSGNLVYQAAEALAPYAKGQGVSILLNKQVPWQAGLGGGSSDAAATLRALNSLWELNWPVERLSLIASKLGSDVPFFLRGGIALAEGRGEIITQLEATPKLQLAIIKPPFGSSTPEVYRHYEHNTNLAEVEWTAIYSALQRGVISDLGPLLSNDLESAAFVLRPELAMVKSKLRTAGFYALLSGSGSSLFTLLSEREQVKELVRLLPLDYSVFAASTL